MKTPKMTIHIPEPCHEDWNKMLPDEKGKFCLSCSKSVHDFSNKTDLEIQQILMSLKGQKVCGRFNKTQLDRPLNIRVNLADLPKNMSSTHSFAIAIFLVFGSLLFSCTDSFGQKMGKVEIVRPKKTDPGMTMGEPTVKNLPPDSISETGTLIKGDVQIEMPVMGKMEIVDPEIKPDSLWEKEQTDTTNLIPDETLISGGLVAIEYHEVDEEKEQLIEELNTSSAISDPEFDLLVYPNPGEGEMTFAYELKKPANVALDIYSEKGELLRTLVRISDQHAGQYRIPTDLSDLGTGIYFATMLIDGKRVTKRVVIGG